MQKQESRDRGLSPLYSGQIRFKALEVLLREKGYADVVREAQEIVELVSKSLLRHNCIEPAGIHDVSPQLEEIRAKFAIEYVQGAIG